MPIKPENRKLYPPNWNELRAERLRIACNRCEFCGLSNYAVGYRDRSGAFVPAYGLAGVGGLTYQEAREHVKDLACANEGTGDVQRRWFVVVLTIAHLYHNPECGDIEQLRSLCQRCHLRYDLAHHKGNSQRTRAAKRLSRQPVLPIGEARP